VDYGGNSLIAPNFYGGGAYMKPPPHLLHDAICARLTQDFAHELGALAVRQS